MINHGNRCSPSHVRARFSSTDWATANYLPYKSRRLNRCDQHTPKLVVRINEKDLSFMKVNVCNICRTAKQKISLTLKYPRCVRMQQDFDTSAKGSHQSLAAKCTNVRSM